MIKKVSLLLTLGMLMLGNTLSAQPPIVLAYVDFPPYEYQENNQPAGILVEIVTTLFARANIPLELRFLPFARAYKEAQSGDIDGLFNFYKTDERLLHFDYSEPLIENPLVFFVRKEADIQFERLEDLKGLRIGAMVGYTYGAEFDNTTLFTIERVNSHQSNFRKLAAGHLDAYPCDQLVGIYVARQENIMEALKSLPNPLNVMEGHIGFTKDKHAETIRKINAEIAKMRQNGEITALINAFLEKLE